MNPEDSADSDFQAAVQAHQRGDLNTAERHYRLVVAREPGHSPACNNLGLTLAMRGRMAEAIALFREALAADPASADAAVNLAQALEHEGGTAGVVEAWLTATTLLPEDMEPPLAAAIVCMGQGNLDQAIDLLEQAAWRTARREGTRAVLLQRLRAAAGACIDDGDLARGHRIAALLSRLEPEDEMAQRMLKRCLTAARADQFDAELKTDVLHCLRSDAVDHWDLSRLAADLLRLQYPGLANPGLSPSATLRACGAHCDELLLLWLTSCLNVDPMLERFLTALRSELLATVQAGGALDDDWRRLLAALALQCVANEFVFTASVRETGLADALAQRLQTHEQDWDALAALACYRAPWTLAAGPRLAARLNESPVWIRELLLESVARPLEERRLGAALAHAPVSDPVSLEVRRQYEESPYPRWRNLERQTPGTVVEFLHDVLPHLDAPELVTRPGRILIAGCGTGEHALRVAARHPDWKVDAVDLSTASLAYAMRKARELGIENVCFRHADILTVDTTHPSYAVIECVGVLHHMHDPGVGLRVLTSLLMPGGVMKLGLYSRRARGAVNRARARIDALGLEAKPRDMRALRQRILAGDEPQLDAVTGSRDFYAMSSVRDLLFHVQEHQYDMQGLRALLEGCALRVLGFQVGPSTRRRYLERFPDDPGLASLESWRAFEDEFPDTFSGMYQFWCIRR